MVPLRLNPRLLSRQHPRAARVCGQRNPQEMGNVVESWSSFNIGGGLWFLTNRVTPGARGADSAHARLSGLRARFGSFLAREGGNIAVPDALR
jgi:hypothetical protein